MSERAKPGWYVSHAGWLVCSVLFCWFTVLRLSGGGPYQGWTLRYPKAGRGGLVQDQETDPTPKGARGILRIGCWSFECGFMLSPQAGWYLSHASQALSRAGWYLSQASQYLPIFLP